VQFFKSVVQFVLLIREYRGRENDRHLAARVRGRAAHTAANLPQNVEDAHDGKASIPVRDRWPEQRASETAFISGYAKAVARGGLRWTEPPRLSPPPKGAERAKIGEVKAGREASL
jgi:hypothetical protein